MSHSDRAAKKRRTGLVALNQLLDAPGENPDCALDPGAPWGCQRRD